MRKRIPAVLLALLLIASLLSGCIAGNETEASGSGEVTDPATTENGEKTEEPTTEATSEAETTAEEQTAGNAETTAEETSSEEEPTTEPETTAVSHVGMTALAVVPNYVNVRTGPSTEYDIVGKIYNYCAAEIIDETNGEDGTWFKITSGNVTGFIKSEFFLVGEEAEAMKSEVGALLGTVMEDHLRIRSAPDLTDINNVFGHYERGTEVYIRELTGDGWAVVETDESSKGYVFASCLSIQRVFKKAISLEEEAAEIARKQEAEERARQAEIAYQEALARQQQQQQQPTQPTQPTDPTQATEPVVDNSPQAALRIAVIEYAKQFVGNPYVHGGRSLVTGTDCSGFTSLVYQHFGYTLSWTPIGQISQGTTVKNVYAGSSKITAADLLPGDLLFYTNSAKANLPYPSNIGHVALYIGNGQIVHAGTEESGIEIRSGFYRDPLIAVRIIN